MFSNHCLENCFVIVVNEATENYSSFVRGVLETGNLIIWTFKRLSNWLKLIDDDLNKLVDKQSGWNHKLLSPKP